MPVVRPAGTHEALRRLRDLVDAGDIPAVDRLLQRQAAPRLRVLVAGEAKRGKSTLINTLLGQDLLPVGVIPLTAVTTTICPGAPDSPEQRVRVTFTDGRQDQVGVAVLADLVTERGNPHNTRGVAEVRVSAGPGPLDRYPIELVDTPGLGSIHTHNTEEARAAYGTLDSAIVVLTADPPISAAEQQLLGEIGQQAMRTFVVLNKSDQLDAEELAQALEFTEQAASAALGHPAQAIACSARTRDAGWRCFEQAFTAYVEQRADRDAAAALDRHLSRLVEQTLDALRIGLAAVDRDDQSAQEQLGLFADRLSTLTRRTEELHDRCWAVERGQLRALNTSAGQLSAELTGTVQAAVRSAFAAELAELGAQEQETAGRELLVRLTTAAVERWRAQEAERLEKTLGELADRLAASTAEQLRDLRAAAADLLDVRLSGDQPVALAEPHRFWYDFSPAPVWEPPLAEVARRLAPGQRKRARSRVLHDLPGLVDRQVGRARADLQQRLHDSVRQLAGTLREGLAGTVERLGAATTAARADRAGSQTDRAEHRRALIDRRDALRSLVPAEPDDR